MRRSYKLNVDTAKLLTSSTISKTTSTSSSTTTTTTSQASRTSTTSEQPTTSSSSTLSSNMNQNHISVSLLENITSSEEKISRGIIFAMLGSLIIFMGVIVIIVFHKPSTKKPQPVEKKELIANEVQPHRSLHV